MRRTTFRISAVVISMFIIAAFTFVPGAMAKTATKENPIVWKVQTPWPQALWVHKDAEIWAKDVEEMSGGRMKIDLYSAGEIVPAFEIFDSVRVGILDAGHTWPGYHIGKFPALTLMAATPAFFDLKGFFTWMFAGGGLELYQEIYGDQVVVYPVAMTYAESGGWANKKIQSLQDFKGLKYRTSLIWGQILSEIGASVVTLPAGDIVPSLQRGTLDAAEFATPVLDLPLGFHEVAKYMYFPGLHQMACFHELIVNPKKWEALPSDLKAILRRAGDASLTRALSHFLLDDCKAFQKYQELGVEIIKFPKEMQQEILNRFVEKYDQHPDKMFQKVWHSQKDFLKLYRPYMQIQQVEAEVSLQ